MPDPTTLTTQALLREVDHLRAEVNLIIDGLRVDARGMRSLLDERYATQTKALDAAFVAAEKAVSTALESADRAVAKAESSSEKRFASVDEFRAQLADQAGTFLNRGEADVRFRALTERVARSEESASTHLARVEYGAAHEQLRALVSQGRDDLSEFKQTITSAVGKLQGDLASLRSRYAGVSVALGIMMSVVVVLITVLQINNK